jgi:hypothetical protein
MTEWEELNTFDRINLEEMTDEWISDGNYSDKTVMDLRDLCLAQKALIGAMNAVSLRMIEEES